MGFKKDEKLLGDILTYEKTVKRAQVVKSEADIVACLRKLGKNVINEITARSNCIEKVALVKTLKIESLAHAIKLA